jgi:hypothetical protein
MANVGQWSLNHLQQIMLVDWRNDGNLGAI